MSGEEKDAVPPALDAAYRAERARPELDPAAERAIRDAVRRRLDAPVGPEGGSGAPGGGGGAPLPKAAGAAASGAGMSRPPALVSGLVGLVVGLIAGALGHAALTAPGPAGGGLPADPPTASWPASPVAARGGAGSPSGAPALPVDGRAATALAGTAEGPSTAPERAGAAGRPSTAADGPGGPGAPPIREPASRAPRTVGGEPGDDAPEGEPSDLAAERRLIDAARADVAEGRFEPALAGLNAHRRRFPAGALAEDRDALAIEALIGAGRRSEATRAAGAFEREHPASLLRGRVRALAAAAVP